MKNKKWIIFFTIIIVVSIVIFMRVSSVLGKADIVEISKDDEKLGIEDKDEKIEPEEDIINIALFGGDRRYKNDVTHSDAIIILTLDKKNEKVKLSSIMRDTYVNVPYYGMTKINHAYGYGGPELAIKTLNTNFDLNIRDYAFVDFYGFEDLIDVLGGIDVEVKDYEAKEMNKFIREVAYIKGTSPNIITDVGNIHLNGEQAVAYSRIRKVGNGDFERTDRQRRVLMELLKKIKKAGITKYPSIVDALLPNVETSITKTEMIKFGTYVLQSDIDRIEEQRFPLEDYSEGQKIDGIWYYTTDLDRTAKDINQFIYENFHDVNDR